MSGCGIEGKGVRFLEIHRYLLYSACSPMNMMDRPIGTWYQVLWQAFMLRQYALRRLIKVLIGDPVHGEKLWSPGLRTGGGNKVGGPLGHAISGQLPKTG
ncbi:hypothetical protein IG631_03153 [Alternaria alternata]|nr:hypothetical protein IG631_03153 [Alternaria alternata]